MIQTNNMSKEAIGKLILNIGSIPAALLGGSLCIGGLLIFLGGMGNTSGGAWVSPGGFGLALGLVAVIPGAMVLGLLYLCRLGPRNPALTIVSACLHLLAGLIGAIYLMVGVNEYNAGLQFPAAVFSPVALITGISSLLGWWLRGAFHSNPVKENEEK
ncbi:MAG: hypothetical protein JNM55_15380 [Anaerolineales bacterium]|nr:hypothetical protein [Anaerolineales bacterium]